MSNKLISVVIANYCGDDSEYLRIAIDSILNQNYPDIELLIVCDGPIDKVRIEYLKSLPSNVIIIDLPENCGPSKARNAGIVMAKGDYIAIMDADDISLPDRLSAQVEFMEENHLDIVSCDLIVIDSIENMVGIRKVPYSYEQIMRLAPLRCPMHNPSAFGRSSVFKLLKYNENLVVSEDYELWVRALLSGYRLGNISVPLVQYRQCAKDIRKRTGYKYAASDFLVKKMALKLSPIYMWPFYYVVAIAASFVRIMPACIFKFFYSRRISGR